MAIGFALAIRSGVQYWTAALASASEKVCPGLSLALVVVGLGESSRAPEPAVAGETTSVEKIKNAANTADNAPVNRGFRIIVRLLRVTVDYDLTRLGKLSVPRVVNPSTLGVVGPG